MEVNIILCSRLRISWCTFVTAEKSSVLTELSRPTNRSSLVVGSVSSLSNLAAAATSAGPVGDGTSLASQLAAVTTVSTTLSNAASSRSLASLQALASATMMDKTAGAINDRLKLESASLESILPTLNGPAIAVSSVSIGLLFACCFLVVLSCAVYYLFSMPLSLLLGGV